MLSFIYLPSDAQSSDSNAKVDVGCLCVGGLSGEELISEKNARPLIFKNEQTDNLVLFGYANKKFVMQNSPTL